MSEATGSGADDCAETPVTQSNNKQNAGKHLRRVECVTCELMTNRSISRFDIPASTRIGQFYDCHLAVGGEKIKSNHAPAVVRVIKLLKAGTTDLSCQYSFA